MNKNDLSERIGEILPKLIEIRRDIHKHPELGFQELRTARIIAEELRPLNLQLETGVVDTGVIAWIEGENPGPTVMLRADIDALPIQEKNDGLAYASINPGIMHACGHDGHTAILIGAIHTLVDLRRYINGKLKFVFQPAEEVGKILPGKDKPVSAAEQMVDVGILDNVSAVLGLHLWPDLVVGQVGFRRGPAMGGSGSFRITINGIGSHAAQPHQGVDSITAIANLINLLQLIVTRKIDPGIPALLNVGTISGGYSPNVVADNVEINGTVRALDQHILDEIFPREIKRAVEGLCHALEAEFKFDYFPEIPVLENANNLVEAARERLCGDIGEKNAVYLNDVFLTGDDFAFYTQRVPGLYFHLGCSGPDQIEKIPLHSPKFNFDEQAIGVGVRSMVLAALALLDKVGEE